VSGTTVRPAAEPAGLAPGRARPGWPPRTPVAAVIAAAAALALGLRAYQIAQPGALLGVAWYDDGVYFASALRLTQGAVPYRDFFFAQPPGITLLMTPTALAAKATGTAGGMAIARVLTLLASTACVILGGLLVRHRGLLAVTVTCGLLAVYPASVGDSRTIFLEPWVALFCLAAALAVFDGDRLAGGRRLAWGGAAFGFAGAVESWAIAPVLIVVALALPRPRRAAAFAGGVAAGFCVPVLPFALLAPRRFYESVVVAQLVRYRQVRVPVWVRLQDMTGLEYLARPSHLLLVLATVIVAGFVTVAVVSAWMLTRRPPPPLEWFGVATAALVALAFMWPPGFFFHFPGFLAPFLALAIALPGARLAAALDAARPTAGRLGARHPLQWTAAALAGLAIAVMAVIQVRAETGAAPRLGLTAIAAARRAIPAGACVLTDQVSFTIAADRFDSGVPGCPLMIDPLGTDYALSPGRDGTQGAGRIPAVAVIMRDAFTHAQYVWLAGGYNRRRIAWTPALHAYFDRTFARVLTDGKGDALYVRKGPRRPVNDLVRRG
jgi:hypothetical protein